ncbi:MAG: helix-hairpin-helix domain-containing protein [Acidimicrobiia bacterium]
MNKIGKVIGLVGGALAILWAMRDRLVSIAAPQDPEPPKFRVVPPQPAPTSTDDLTSITGIGPVFAGRLRDAGIMTYADVAGAGAAKLAEVTGTSEARAADWVAAASTLV